MFEAWTKSEAFRAAHARVSRYKYGSHCDQNVFHLNRLDRLETRGGPILCWLYKAFSFQ